jgi:hypothetical protein
MMSARRRNVTASGHFARIRPCLKNKRDAVRRAVTALLEPRRELVRLVRGAMDHIGLHHYSVEHAVIAYVPSIGDRSEHRLLLAI